MIEGSVELGQNRILVQDEQLMVYIPGGEGGSEPLTAKTVEKLEFITHLAKTHLRQAEKERLFASGGAGDAFREFIRTNVAHPGDTLSGADLAPRWQD